jgi:Integrase core domain
MRQVDPEQADAVPLFAIERVPMPDWIRRAGPYEHTIYEDAAAGNLSGASPCPGLVMRWRPLSHEPMFDQRRQTRPGLTGPPSLTCSSIRPGGPDPIGASTGGTRQENRRTARAAANVVDKWHKFEKRMDNLTGEPELHSAQLGTTNFTYLGTMGPTPGAKPDGLDSCASSPAPRVIRRVEPFPTLTVAQVVVDAWRTEDNSYRPHSALGGRTPAEYAASWTSTSRPALS